MTAQIPETLHFHGEKLSLCGCPLGSYLRLAGIQLEFRAPMTCLWRGYVGSWEIVDDRLYLIDLHGKLADGTDVNLATLFPDFPQRVFAHWYTGVLRAPRGKLLEYVHQGWGSTYEEDVFFAVRRGVVQAVKVQRNGTGAPDAPEGYGVAATYVFGRDKGGER